LARSEMDAPLVLVAGGAADPNLKALLATLDRRGVPAARLLVGAAEHPHVTWDLDADTLALFGCPIRPTSAFLRHDVFDALANRRQESAQRAFAWYAAAMGWILAHPGVTWLNRRAAGAVTFKPHVLALARDVGLAVPRTLVSNDAAAVAGYLDEHPKIAKPVGGGGLCVPLDAALAAAPQKDGALAAPALVQERLVAPELRVYRAGSRWLAFEVESPHLDYRSTHEVTLRPVGVPQSILGPLDKLTGTLGLDFAAADFKTHPDSGAWVFLEVNTAPMFAAFDVAANGALTSAIVDALVG
jgi:hypothetical protein